MTSRMLGPQPILFPTAMYNPGSKGNQFEQSLLVQTVLDCVQPHRCWLHTERIPFAVGAEGEFLKRLGITTNSGES